MKKTKGIILVSSILVFLIAGVIGVFMLMNKSEQTVNGNKADIDWYTEDGKEFVIDTVDELYGLVKLSNYYNFSGQVIKLGADIVVNDGNAKEWAKKAPSRTWYPIDGFAGEFDGQGHSISGIYGKGAVTAIGLFSNTKVTSRIKDFRLLNSYFEMNGTEAIGSIVANGCGTFEKLYSDAIVTSNGVMCGGIVGSINDDGTVSTIAKTSKMTNCWFDGEVQLTTKMGRYGGGLVGRVSGGALNMEHCLNSGAISCESEETNGLYVGGLLGGVVNVNYSGTVNVMDSLSVGTVTTKIATAVGAIAGGLGSKTEMTIDDTYTTEDTCQDICQKQSGKLTGGVPVINTDFIIGEDWYRYTTLDFDTNWTVTVDSTPVLRCFTDEIIDTSGLVKAYNMDWYSAAQYEQVIRTKEDLYGFVLLSHGDTFTGKLITLGNDIVVNEGKATDWKKGKNTPDNCWMPIARNMAFQGVFDGKGHTISGIYGTTDIPFYGLFGWTGVYSEIKNVNIKNSYFTTTTSILGSVAGRVEGRVDTVYSDALLSAASYSVGGIGGYKKTETQVCVVTNCWYDGTIDMIGDNTIHTGGIVGRHMSGTLTIDNCLFTGEINVGGKKRSANTGGLIGYSAAGVLTIKGSLNDGVLNITEAEKMNSLSRVIGQIKNIETVKVVMQDTYFTTKGDNPNSFYYCAGDKAIIVGAAEAKTEENIKGYNGYLTTSLDFGKYWTVVVNEDGTPILKSFAKKIPSVAGLTKIFDKSWYDAEKSSYVLKDEKDLYGFLYLSNSKIDFVKKTITLANDIQVHQQAASDWAQGEAIPDSVYNWSGIGKLTNFQGTFDGKGYTISGLYGTTNASTLGLFGYIGTEGTVKNLRLHNIYFEDTGTGSASIGSVTGRLEGTIHTVYSDALLASTGTLIGGIAGNKKSTEKDSTITNCWYAGEIQLKGDKAGFSGGIVGRLMNGDLTVDNSLFSGTIQIGGKTRSSNTGGFVGNIAAGKLTIKNCLNSGEFTITEAEKMNSLSRVIGQIANTTNASVDLQNTYFTTEGDNASSFYYCAGDKPTIVGVAEAKSAENILGYNGYQTTSLNFGKYWTVVVNEDGTPILKSFANNVPSVEGLTKIFDKSWYDAEKSSYVLKDAKDLYGLLYLSNSKIDFKGKTIILDKNIVVNTGEAADWAQGKSIPGSVYNWSGIGKITNFQGTFDGKGRTISGLYGTTNASTLGLFGYIGTEGTVKNLRLQNIYFEDTSTGSASMGSVAGRLEGTIHRVYSDAILASSGTLIGGIVGNKKSTEKDSTITNCWYEGEIQLKGDKAGFAGGMVGRLMNGNLTVDNSLFSGTIQIGGKTRSSNTGGFVGNIAEGKLTIKNCLNSGEYTITDAEKMNSLCRVIGQITNATNVSVDIQNTYFTTKGDNANLIYYCAGNKASIKGTSIKVKETDILGNVAYYHTMLDFEKNWTLVTKAVNGEDGTPILRYFADKISPLPQAPADVDISWYDKDRDTYTISTEEELYGVSYLSNMGVTFAGKNIRLNNDIFINLDSMNPNDTIYDEDGKWDEMIASVKKWTPIGTSESPFAGTFDGKGKTISGVYATSEKEGFGLFAATAEGSTIKNLKLENSYFKNSSASYTGSIVGQCAGNLENVYSNAYVEAYTFSGGLIGTIVAPSKDFSVNIVGCWFDGDMKVLGNTQGGIVGSITNGNITITNCLNSGDINAGTRNRIGGLCGSIVGSSDLEQHVTLTMKSCLNYGEITGGTTSSPRIATIVGNIGVETKGTIEHVYATNESYTGTEAGGVGYGYKAGSSKITLDIQKVVLGDITTSNNITLGDVVDTLNNLDFKKVYSIGAQNTPILQWATELEFDTSWYEENAAKLSIGTVEELYSLAYLMSVGENFDGKTVSLNNDIVINSVSLNPKDTAYQVAGKWDEMVESVKTWTSIGTNESPFAGTFDGNYYSIQGVYMDVNQNGGGLFAATAAGSTIKNLKLENSYIKNVTTVTTRNGYSYTGSIVGECAGNLENVYSNAYVEAKVYSGGLIGDIPADSNVSITSCWFDGDMKAQGNNQGGIVGHVSSGVTITIEDCLNTGDITAANSTRKWIGGICGRIQTTAFTMERCLNYGTLPTTNNGQVGSIVGQCGSSTSGTINKVYATNEGYTGTESSSNNTIGVIKVPEAEINENKLETWGFDTALVWMIHNNKKPSLQWVSSMDWYDKTKDNYVIHTPSELIGLAILGQSGNDFEGKTITLAADIVFNGGNANQNSNAEEMSYWTPIGTLESPFAGIFDGNGKTISGVYAVGEQDGFGLFAATAEGSTIKNLKLENSYIKNSAGYTGSVVGQCAGNLKNVYSNAYVEAGAYSGGLIGIIRTDSVAEVSKCWFDGQIVAKGQQQGGLVGRIMRGEITMSDCLNTGDIDCDQRKFIGGLCGSVAIDGGSINLTMKNCLNYGQLTNCKSATNTTDVRTSSVIGNIGGNDTTNGYTNSVKAISVYTTEESYSGTQKAIGIGHGSLADNTEIKKVLEDSINLESLTTWGFDTSVWIIGNEGTPALKK